MRHLILLIIILILTACGGAGISGTAAQSTTPTAKPDIGVYYYPGWYEGASCWNDIWGLPGSRSPGVKWLDRKPSLGWYYQNDPTVIQRQIDMAADYGITFFAYDWYWEKGKPMYDLSLNNHLTAPNRDRLKFALNWANHFNGVPSSSSDFDAIVTYWIQRYFSEPIYYKIDGKPVIYIFDYALLDANARKFGETGTALLARAQQLAIAKGYAGIYFIAISNDRPNALLENKIKGIGFSAYTGWNYVQQENAPLTTDYNQMVDTYLDYYTAATTTGNTLPYISSASPGWDSRPWQGDKPAVYYRTDPTPEKFGRMLSGAKALLDKQPSTTPKILMIEAWNEFGEGSYIEPTEKWGTQYLDVIKNWKANY